ncbi:hypothetical protein [Wenjunlia tyrosinilytica]|uniref:Uncharacterized protein n=1 Tax=Wenjunlia tyrosinilytica TaxID=1544741 RepID=A0A918DR45_9ACTN|nr:hypothetical protein [Wenjunlia tyrosinilytica]GGO80246.1 hypothetical protein GCM10012280_01660 [Wenjunlia tyrosinilytica]
MNIRSLTRGDGAVIGAALLLFIGSFLGFFTFEDRSFNGSSKDYTVSAWSPATFPLLPTVHLAALIGVALIILGRSANQSRKIAGLELPQWGTALCVFAGWSALWSVFSNLWPSISDIFDEANDKTDLGAGAWLTFVFGIAVAVLAVLGNSLPALKAPLMSAPRQPQPQPQPGYGYPGQTGQPGHPGQPGGYGYPAQGVDPSFGGQAAAAPGPQAAPATGAQEFTPFWFAVPVARPLFPEDGSSGAPIAELTPGQWYLAVDQRGPAIIAQTQDGRRGVLQDSSGIQRG